MVIKMTFVRVRGVPNIKSKVGKLLSPAMRLTAFACASLCLVVSCSPGQQEPSLQPPDAAPATQQGPQEPVSLADLEREAADITSAATRQETARPDASDGQPVKLDTSGVRTLPTGAAHYVAGKEGNMTAVTSTPASLSRTIAKAAPEGSQAGTVPDLSPTVAFAGASR
jgi:hypothetical protein